MENGLIRVIEAEALKERESILDEANKQAGELVDRARLQAERIRASALPTNMAQATSDGSEPEALDRWRCACERLLNLHQQRVEQLRECATARLAAIEEETRHGLLATIFAETLEEIAPGPYRVEAPAGVLRLVTLKNGLKSRGFELETGVLEGDEVVVSSPDKMLVLRWSLAGMVERYLSIHAEKVSERMLGDGAA
jgi:vacuolar-type H+-ATPase subunit E/Vma4